MSEGNNCLDLQDSNNCNGEVLGEDRGGGCKSSDVEIRHYHCNCGRTFTDIASTEEESPNKLCKSCVSEAKFKSLVDPGSLSHTSKTSSTTTSASNGNNSSSKSSQDQPPSDGLGVLSPLTNRSDISSHHHLLGGASGGLKDDGLYNLEDTHRVAVSLKAPN